MMSQNETTPDELPEDANEDAARDSGQLEQNLKRRSTWVRLVFMLILIAIYAITRIVFGAVIVFQFLWVLFTAETNKQLTELGQSLATYTYQIMRYLSFNTEDKPFPFDAEWPSGSTDD
jgi:cytoskeletal protein RodZ